MQIHLRDNPSPLFPSQLHRTPFQTCPLDFGTDAFYAARRDSVNARLALIAEGGAATLLAETWDSECGVMVRGVGWERYPRSDLLEICRWVAENLDNGFTVMSDSTQRSQQGNLEVCPQRKSSAHGCRHSWFVRILTRRLCAHHPKLPWSFFDGCRHSCFLGLDTESL